MTPWDNFRRRGAGRQSQNGTGLLTSQTCTKVQVKATREPTSAATRSGVVDLRALQPIGIIHVYRFPLGVKIQRCLSRLAVAVAGILDSAERQMRLGANGGRV